jgi:hypothetical protein
MPELLGIFVGGCIERGVGSRFRHQAHAHCHPKDAHKGWVCVLSHRRLYSQTRTMQLVDIPIPPDHPWVGQLGQVRHQELKAVWTPTTQPSRLMWHEYAHIITEAGHDDRWRAAMKQLGQPLPKHYQKKPRPKA